MNHQKFIGINSLDRLPEILTVYGKNKILLVTGKNSYTKGGIEKRLLPLLEGFSFIRFIDYSENPKLEEAILGADIFVQNNCDLIIAIGGGSAMDTAKMINVIISNPLVNPRDILRNTTLINSIDNTLIAIPTTAGTGSEATHFAVVYMDGKKYSVAHSALIPNTTIVDSTLTNTMSPYLTACTGLDALCQAIESHWSVNATEESRNYAIKALHLILPKIESTVNHPNEENRASMSEGAYWAGRAINISKTTAPHAFSYYLTSNHDIPHGHAVALWMPVFFKINNKSIHRELHALLSLYLGDDLIDGFRELVENLNLENQLYSIIKSKNVDLNKIIDSVNTERLGNNPVKVNLKDLNKIILP